MSEEKKTAMISSTSLDLPEHRKEAIEACLRQGLFPIAMEHLPARDHWGLVAAQKHLLELGSPEPEMPPFDASKFGPMPEVEIDPDDEFHAGPDDETR